MSATVASTPSQTAQTRIGCLAVNAAFLREIKDDNRFLDELLLATRDAILGVDPTRLNVRALVELLRRLRDRLAMHFSLEEAFGYFENAREFPADLSLQADTCRREHEVLYLDVCDAVEAAEKLLYHESDRQHRILQNLSTSFGHFIRKLNQHDAHENVLIDAAMAAQKSRIAP